MKKLLITSALMLTSLFSTAQSVGVDHDRVYNRQLKINGDAQWLRVNHTVDGINYGVLSRQTKYDTGLGLWTNLEGSVGKTFDIGLPFKVSSFVAAGYDAGRNGAVNASFWYTRVGVGTGFPVGPGRLNLGVNTRLNFEPSDPKQSVVSAVYSVPVTEKLSVSLRVINSYQTIKEDYRGIGLTYRF
jgi:hypothetical protein